MDSGTRTSPAGTEGVMGTDDKHGEENRADELQELVDRLASGATGPGGESLREAVHRRMRELSDESTTAEKRGERDAGEDHGSP
ncbi:hypothetical protein [Streptomyces fuscichromogenes]|uniref:Uncharacterized protein n=1 Tax=Streptomyces fuscichromogenes TaxID=1324013 RepID=A0A917XCQ8_9ACTN|nr:hypothetical protein [Streptomyces fuscichromogenes]GGN10366.1 hypothetical protein GCM10011578_036060 [Streptomyces fuscichromogenes]